MAPVLLLTAAMLNAGSPMVLAKLDKLILGVNLFTAILTVALILPAVLLAVTVYTMAAVACVGVPEIIPVVALMLKPAGKAGLITKAVAVPPMVGTNGLMLVLPYTHWDLDN